jgi:hypothetical protein
LGRLRDWWGTEDKFKVLEEERLEKELLERKDSSTVSLGSVMVVYRNLRAHKIILFGTEYVGTHMSRL